MHVEILALYEKGKRKPDKARRQGQRLYADVNMRIDQHGPLGRPSMMASILNPNQHQPYTLPPLYEARVEGMATLAFVIEGVEFIEGVMYQQAWHCSESSHKVAVPWRLCPRGPLDELL